MGRLIALFGICLLILGALMTFKVPLDWIGRLPGDFSMKWQGMRCYIPVTTSFVFSLILSIFCFLFARH